MYEQVPLSDPLGQNFPSLSPADADADADVDGDRFLSKSTLFISSHSTSEPLRGPTNDATMASESESELLVLVTPENCSTLIGRRVILILPEEAEVNSGVKKMEEEAAKLEQKPTEEAIAKGNPTNFDSLLGTRNLMGSLHH